MSNVIPSCHCEREYREIQGRNKFLFILNQTLRIRLEEAEEQLAECLSKVKELQREQRTITETAVAVESQLYDNHISIQELENKLRNLNLSNE